MPSVQAYRARKHEIEILNMQLVEAEAALREAQIHLSTMNEVKDALLAECKRLTLRSSIFECYIRHAYWNDVDMPVVLRTEIPSCLKPLDAIKFAGGPEPMMFPIVDPDDEDYQPGDNIGSRFC